MVWVWVTRNITGRDRRIEVEVIWIAGVLEWLSLQSSRCVACLVTLGGGNLAAGITRLVAVGRGGCGFGGNASSFHCFAG